MKPLDALINEGMHPTRFGLHLIGAFDTASPEQWDESSLPSDHRMVGFRLGTRGCAAAVNRNHSTPNLWQPGREKRLERMRTIRLQNARARAAAN